VTPLRITVIDGHPDPDPERFIHALAQSYANGAAAGGHDVRRIALAELESSLLCSRHDWEGDYIDHDIRRAQEDIAGMPAVLYRVYYGAHSVKSFQRNILKFVGVAPVEHLLVGNVEGDVAARASGSMMYLSVGQRNARDLID
jgi:hypothetical protein